jgi:hypothetical protein
MTKKQHQIKATTRTISFNHVNKGGTFAIGYTANELKEEPELRALCLQFLQTLTEFHTTKINLQNATINS